MEPIITNIKAFENESYEIRYYERGLWHIDVRVNDEEEAMERMNHLILKYGYHADEVAVTKLTYFENITE